MHWEAHEITAVVFGVVLTMFAAAPGLGIADRVGGLIGGLAFTGYGVCAALDDALFRLSPFAYALPVIGVLWLLGSLRAPMPNPGPNPVPTPNPVPPPGPTPRPTRYQTPLPDVLSPALWAALPPAPVSPAVGLPVRAPLATPVRAVPEGDETAGRGESARRQICERCGRRREAGANFCAGCGRALFAGAEGLPDLFRVQAASRPNLDDVTPPAPELQPEPPRLQIPFKEEYRMRDLRGDYSTET